MTITRSSRWTRPAARRSEIRRHAAQLLAEVAGDLEGRCAATRLTGGRRAQKVLEDSVKRRERSSWQADGVNRAIKHKCADMLQWSSPEVDRVLRGVGGGREDE
jgi:hypothetical protein